MKRTLFASEIPCLLGLNKFKSKEQILDNFLKRGKTCKKEPNIVDNMMKLSLQEDNSPHVVIKGRDLTPTIHISGKMILEENEKSAIVYITRERKSKITRKIWPEDECLAQVYLWILEPEYGKNTHVVFQEECGTDLFVTTMESNELFVHTELQCLLDIVNEG